MPPKQRGQSQHRRLKRRHLTAPPPQPTQRDPNDRDFALWPPTPKRPRRPVYRRQRDGDHPQPLQPVNRGDRDRPPIDAHKNGDAEEYCAELDAQSREEPPANAHVDANTAQIHVNTPIDSAEPFGRFSVATPLIEIQLDAAMQPSTPPPPLDRMMAEFLRQQFLDTREHENIPPEYAADEFEEAEQPETLDEGLGAESVRTHSSDSEDAERRAVMDVFQRVLNSFSRSNSLEEIPLEDSAFDELPDAADAEELDVAPIFEANRQPAGYHRRLFRNAISQRESRRVRGRGRPRRRSTTLRVHRRMVEAARANPTQN